MDKLEKLVNILRKTKNLVFFGGAGVSVASNIPDFRSSNGLFQEIGMSTPEELLSRRYFDQHPEVFFNFYKSRMIYPEAKPNPAHLALSRLEEMGKLQAVITQNIDCLHQMAGNSNVIELHGTIKENYCLKCNKFYSLDYVMKVEGVPYCSCGGIIKPNVVLYEEHLDEGALNKARNYIAKAETLIVSGTSLLVNPAAGLIRYFGGDDLVIINKSKTSFDIHADLVIHGDVAVVLSEAVSNI